MSSPYSARGGGAYNHPQGDGTYDGTAGTVRKTSFDDTPGGGRVDPRSALAQAPPRTVARVGTGAVAPSTGFGPAGEGAVPVDRRYGPQSWAGTVPAPCSAAEAGRAPAIVHARADLFPWYVVAAMIGDARTQADVDRIEAAVRAHAAYGSAVPGNITSLIQQRLPHLGARLWPRPA